MEDTMEETVDYTYTYFNGQTTKMRKFAIEKLGIEKVASMTDDDIQEWMKTTGYVPIAILTRGLADWENIYIINKDELEKLPCFRR